MEETKYRIPSINEFHVGMEFEAFHNNNWFFGEGGEEWVKQKWQPQFFRHHAPTPISGPELEKIGFSKRGWTWASGGSHEHYEAEYFIDVLDFSLRYEMRVYKNPECKSQDLAKFIIRGNGGYDDAGEMELPHIKTIPQVKELYRVLTGKEL
jgi:hypothetical protein